MPRLELRAEQVRAEALRPGQHADQLHQERPHQRPDDRGRAVARDRGEHEAECGDAGEREHVDREAGGEEADRVTDGDRRSRQRRQRMQAPGDRPRERADESHREHEHHRVAERREQLPGKDLAALARACEDRLQRPVVALRRDDVPCDERRD